MSNSITSIALVNQSSLTAADLTKYAAAQTTQIQRDLSPIWKRFASVYFAPDASQVPAEDWLVTIYDQPQTPEDAGALGYHETDGKVRPIGKVFQLYAVKDGSPWSTVLSHEVLEMLGDEWANEIVTRYMPDNSLQLWPRELCDAVQGQWYDVDGVSLSNFVFPGYFIDGYDGQKDQMGKVTTSFQVTDGGYSSLILVSASGATQRNVYGAEHPAWRIDLRKGGFPKAARLGRHPLIGRFPTEDVILPKAA